MKLHPFKFSLAIFTAVSSLCAAAKDRLDQPPPPGMLEDYTDSLLAGKGLRYAFFGTRPPLWIENATGDEMLRRATEGELPEDDRFTHMHFIYGTFWDNCRTYYMGYRSTGDQRLLEQLRQYARYQMWVLENRPWLFVEKHLRDQRPDDWRTVIPRDAPFASIFQGAAMAARLTLQAALSDRSLVTDKQVREARSFLETIVSYMDSLVRGDGRIDEKTSLPMVAANIVDATPYNQSFMYYATLGLTAAGLEEAQRLDGHGRHQETIDLYTRIVKAGVKTFMERSDTTRINGKPYVFQSYTPKDPLMSLRDPKTKERIPQYMDGHPVFRYPEDWAHGQSESWYMILLWETRTQHSIPESLLEGIANAHVDYLLKAQVPLKDGSTGPPSRLLSPWLVSWYLEHKPSHSWDRLGRAPTCYGAYLPFRADVARAIQDFNPRGRKEMGAMEGMRFVLFGYYLKALRQHRPLLYLPRGIQ